MGRPGLVGTMARTAVIAGTATAVSGSIQKKQQAGAAQAQAAAEQQAAPPPPPPPAVPQDAPPAAGPGDLMDQLERLANLKTSGLLSDEEFSAAKAQLLGM
ncbi:MAG TPA: SHOCT domain-containing protein [Lapillicoccus sp.]|uniref:SHOCT domain-containing protein n=1 Tax=Lapillicoccus sp. TaxID=1909287 RepID=UPI002F946BE5